MNDDTGELKEMSRLGDEKRATIRVAQRKLKWATNILLLLFAVVIIVVSVVLIRYTRG